MNEFTDTTDQMLEEEVLTEETSQETSEESEEEAAILKAENEKLLKENAKLKKLFSNAREHTKEKQTITTKQDNNGLSRQEVILFAKGLTENDVEEAKFIAERLNITVMEAVETDRYKIYKESQEREQQAKKAQMGASKRGSSFQQPKTFNDKMSDEEHKALFDKTFK